MDSIQQLVFDKAHTYGDATAIVNGTQTLSYSALGQAVVAAAGGFNALLAPQQRLAVYLPKTIETVVASLATMAAGAVLVPINPVLKAAQVQHIINDSEATVLVTQRSRLALLGDWRTQMPSLRHIVLIDANDEPDTIAWSQLLLTPSTTALAPVASHTLAALLYTSGSTGLPKGVMLSHQNLLLGARSVASYLALTRSDKILAVLPFSFDYGFNQLLSSLWVGAQCVLLDYLLPPDIPKACARFGITGLAAVPPLWIQLAAIDWPTEAVTTLRYFTNSGGHLPAGVLAQLRAILPLAEPVLMYGLTEAFRSSYLPPSLVDAKPSSMGTAIPYAQLYVLNDNQALCAPGEVGELVHAGPLVSQGYWRRPEQTALRFKPLPAHLDAQQPLAVWSGDNVYQDDDGFLYFKGRRDDQIKVSGYRVSPEEVEAAIAAIPEVHELAAVGIAHPTSGQSIALALVLTPQAGYDEREFIMQCRRLLPAYMVPSKVQLLPQLPRNANGKLDRPRIAEMLS